MAIINLRHRFVFVHVPKCAGTTVTSYYSQFSGPLDLEVGGTPLGEKLQPHYRKNFGLDKHADIKKLAGTVAGYNLGKFFYFTFTRNPVDRVVSSFHFLKKWLDRNEHPDREAVSQFNNPEEMFMSGYRADRINRMLHPQVSWLLDGQGTLAVDFLGRMENLAEDVARLDSELGLEPVQELPSLNVSPESEFRFSSEALDAIRDYYRQDFELLGYET